MLARCRTDLAPLDALFACVLVACVLIACVFVVHEATAAAALATAAPPAPPDSLVTLFEASAGERTPRYAETAAYCRRLAAAVPQLTCLSFGRTPQGRELLLLVADPAGRADPVAVRADPQRSVLLVQACIHAGESCGKDAGLLLLRDLALGDRLAGLLERLTILFIPILNADGHERFGPHHRVNQNGPAEMGWRVNAANLNLNRDFLKADTPEIRAWLDLWNAWLPDFFVDVHSTDGADYQYPLTWQMELGGSLDTDLTAWSRGLLGDLALALAADGVPVAPYVWFRDWGDPTSGLVSWVAEPRFSQGYAALQNRPGLLLEAHMLKPYAERVGVVRRVLQHLCDRLADPASQLPDLVRAADARTASSLRDAPFPLRFEMTGEPEPFDFLGFAWEERTGEVSGGRYTVYHADRPETVTVDRYPRQRVTATVQVPAAYLVPPEWQDVIARLEAHGVVSGRLRHETSVAVRGYRFTDPSWRREPYEGRHPATFAVADTAGIRTFPAGTAVVSTAQRGARVAIHALEPRGPDSFAAWGFFDAVFLPVEYIEARVIEGMIPVMLADPELRRRFAVKRSSEPDFAADPQAIREWFYRQSPYADTQAGRYPVGLVDDPSVVEFLLAP